MVLTVSSSCHSIEVETEKARRLIVVLLSLLRQIEPIDQGKLTLSWSSETSIKWCVESYGKEGIDMSSSSM